MPSDAVTYVVVDTDGGLHTHTDVPTSTVITGHVGEPGWARVRLAEGVAGWVNDTGFLCNLPRNVVGSCLLLMTGANEQPYAGPVVITGWHPYDEIVPLALDKVEYLTAAHTAIRRVLDENNHSPGFAAAIQRAAAIVTAAPTPTIRVLHDDALAYLAARRREADHA